jgi:hypothetical protein
MCGYKLCKVLTAAQGVRCDKCKPLEGAKKDLAMDEQEASAGQQPAPVEQSQAPGAAASAGQQPAPVEQSQAPGAAAAGADDGAKAPAPAGAVEPPSPAPAGAVEPPRCEKCRVFPADGGSRWCEGCNMDRGEELELAKKKKMAAWEAGYKAEKDAKKLYFDAMTFAINEYHPETMRCAACSLAKKTGMPVYCAEHQGKIDSAVAKWMSKR